MSIGLTRIFSKALSEGLIKTSAKSPTNVLIAYLEGSEKSKLNNIANEIRKRNFNVELYHVVDKFCLLYTSPSPRDATLSRMPSSA